MISHPIATSLLLTLSVVTITPSMAGRIRGSSSSPIQEDLYRQVLKMPKCDASVTGKQGYYTTEIIVSNVLDDEYCGMQISSEEMGKEIDNLVRSTGVELAGVMDSHPQLRSSMCNHPRRLNSYHSPGWLWGGGGHSMFCDTKRGWSATKANETSSFGEADDQEDQAADRQNQDSSSSTKPPSHLDMETVDGSDTTYDSILWKYQSVLKTKLQLYINATLGDSCFESEPDVDLFITPVKSMYEATLSNC